ncbi:rho guanine nucleotide exchange factor at 64C [Anticarsia gemmatalis]|uniref:rho guanine nucleotide exchange factor at 64C n=1 Tax=Anticarsia gemmatalis TaxID=129554 RepID=UPI003F75E88C
MAAVSAAMFRPGGGLDPSCYATQRIYDTPENTRPKKWSSKLKLNTSGSSKTSEKSPESPYMYGTISGPGGSALSKSMKYAETWLYGSVRTQTPPVRPSIFSAYPEVPGPVLISTPQKPTPHNYAVILCSCPEYLNGTKKTSSTKVSICKKCKGSRLPLTIAESPQMLVGGTVRGHQVSRETGLLRAGTVRVPGTKARPTILKSNGDTDPYDLMRRSRLAPPHEARIGSQFSTTRLRAKSISPCRVKTKKPSPETLQPKNRSKSVSRVNEIWVEEEANNSSDSKKSILSCDINPYDLVKSNGNSKSLVEIEFDDDFGNVFQESLKNNNLKPSSKSKTDSSVKAISGQRIRVSDESKSVEDTSIYDPVDYDLKSYELKSQENSSTLSLPNIKNENKKSASISKNTSKKILSISTSNRAKQKSVSPKRPPRRIRNTKTDDDSESDNQRLTERNSNRKTANDNSRNSKHKNHHTDTIKSILKKPRNYDSNDSNSKLNSPDESYERKRVNSSLFYLPKPKDKGAVASQNILQRKRVQFLVESEETKVIYTAEFNLEQPPSKDAPVEVNVDTEEDVVAEGDIVSHSLDESSEKLEELLSQTTQLTLSPQHDAEVYDHVHINTFEPVIEQDTELVTETVQQTTSVEVVNSINKEDNNIPKVPVLRRSESERIAPTLFVEPPKFLDTMALRPKSKHGHTSQVFLTSVVENEVCNQHQYVPNQPQEVPQETKPAFNDNMESGNLSDSSDITRNILNNLRRGISESPEPPPRMKSKERTKSKKHNYVKTRFVRNNSTSSTSDEWSDANDYEQKTILRVKQFDSDTDEPKTQSGVMRSSENEPRKTSIQINGNECYSTMNVSSDTPIYLSSVVVNDDYGNTCNTYQTGTTVTISVGTPQKEIKKSKSQIYIGAVLSQESEKKLEANTYEEYYADRNNDSRDQNSSRDLSSILNDPVEAVKRNLIPHVCGKKDDQTLNNGADLQPKNGNFVTKLFDDPFFAHLADGLDSDLVKKLIENSLIKLQETKNSEGTDSSEITIEKLIESSLKNLKEESAKEVSKKEEMKPKNENSAKDVESKKQNSIDSSVCAENEDNSCSAPYESMEYESGAMGVFSDLEPMSDCYNASASELSTEDDTNSTRSKFYQMLVDAALCEIEIANNTDDDHHYESIRLNSDPIYEEIGDMPPPLPVNPPPNSLLILDDDKRSGSRSIFEGASKYDILSYLVDAKERGIDDEETYITSYATQNESSNAEESKEKTINREIIDTHLSSNTSQLSNASDSSEDNSLIINHESLEKAVVCKKTSAEIERNDSGVGSETSKSSRSRLQGKTSPCNTISDKDTPIHLCEDCDTAVETQLTEQGSIYAPLVCRKCAKKRAERKEIITEIVETEEKYGRDLQIILEEFYKPMLVAGLLTQEQLSAIFLNVEELIENNQVLSEKLRDGLEIAVDQGDEDLLTVNVGKILLECSGMLTAFQSYCVKQAGAALLLAGLEKEKELLRIFLRVSQMENAVLRRMNLNSFLMVPVQRVTKYPLLLSRLYRATAACATEREDVKAAQRCVESRLEEINAAAAAAAAAARDVPLWRRLAAARRTAHDLHVADIKLRKMAVDVLDWNHDDARFAMEGKLLFTQPNDNNWRKGRTIKLTPINALLVTNGKPTITHKTNEIRETREARDREAREKEGEALFARSGVREAALLLVREKAGRYTLQREPLFLDRCVVAADHEPEHFFEVHEITTKDSYIFKAEENTRTRTWYRQLQYHAQGAGAWRKRRNALANIMINPMLTRN